MSFGRKVIAFGLAAVVGAGIGWLFHWALRGRPERRSNVYPRGWEI